MTLISFPLPYVHKLQRHCRRCGDPVEVICLGGATCPRDPHYTCGECRHVPEALPDRLSALLEGERNAQLALGEGRPSEAIGTLDPENNEAAPEDGSHKDLWRGAREPIQPSGQTSTGGEQPHG